MEPDFKTIAESLYPVDDPRKVICHDNQGQYSRQEAFVNGAEYVWLSHVEPLTKELVWVNLENKKLHERAKSEVRSDHAPNTARAQIISFLGEGKRHKDILKHHSKITKLTTQHYQKSNKIVTRFR